MKSRSLKVFVLSQLEERDFKKLEEGGVIECKRNNGVYVVKKVINKDNEIIPIITNIISIENAKNVASFIGVINNRLMTSGNEGKLITLNDKTCKELEESGESIYNSNGFNYQLKIIDNQLKAININENIKIDFVLLQSEVATTNF